MNQALILVAICKPLESEHIDQLNGCQGNLNMSLIENPLMWENTVFLFLDSVSKKDRRNLPRINDPTFISSRRCDY